MTENIDKNTGKLVDPTCFLPDEPMIVEVKKKKKKRKHDQEDPFKDVKETSFETTIIIEREVFDPEKVVKIEDIEVTVDCNEFLKNHGLIEDSQESKADEDGKDVNEMRLSLESNFENDSLYNSLPIEDTTTYICNVCNLVFSNSNTLRTHQVRKHDSFKQNLNYKCVHCDMAYDKKPSLEMHIKRKHGNNTVPDDKEERVCDICSLAFVGMSRLRMHMQRKHGCFSEAFNHQCPYCGLSYDKYSSLVVHMQRKHTEREKVHQIHNCPFCPKIFSVKESYMMHVRRKHRVTYDMNTSTEDILKGNMNEYGDFVCPECALAFSNVGMLKIHMRRNHDAYKDIFRLKCTICNLSYDRVTSLKRHIKRKHDKCSYCVTCQKQFDTYDLYLNHTHQKQILECEICGKIFASQRAYNNHMSSMHNVEVTPFKMFCDKCSQGFNDRRQLRVHIMKVHSDLIYTCCQCDKKFRIKESLRQHIIRKHTKKDPNTECVCELCSQKFNNEKDLCNHIDSEHTKHGIKEEENYENSSFNLYQCTKCPDSYASWELLKLHNTRDHVPNGTGTKCHICNQILRTEHLARHLKSHDSLKCQYCDYVADQKVNLTKHLLRHKDISPLKCDLDACAYTTLNPVALEKHKLKHSNDAVKLQCSKCPFQSLSKYTMKYHEEEHFTGKKQYDCDKCNYSTLSHCNLLQHKNKHLPDKKYKCEVCPFATKYNTSLRFHIKKKHCDLPVRAN